MAFSSGMKALTLLAAISLTIGAQGGEKLHTNQNHRAQLPVAEIATTNKAQLSTNNVSAEERLLRFFPQLRWEKTKLEFIFDKQDELERALLAAADPENEAWKLANEFQRTFKTRAERKEFTEGWERSGTKTTRASCFSKKHYNLSGIIGEAQLLYDGDVLISFGFWTDGSNADFTKLYRLLESACQSSGQRSSDGPDDSRVKWTIHGKAVRYEIELTHRAWKVGGAERGMYIMLHKRK